MPTFDSIIQPTMYMHITSPVELAFHVVRAQWLPLCTTVAKVIRNVYKGNPFAQRWQR